MTAPADSPLPSPSLSLFFLVQATSAARLSLASFRTRSINPHGTLNDSVRIFQIEKLLRDISIIFEKFLALPCLPPLPLFFLLIFRFSIFFYFLFLYIFIVYFALRPWTKIEATQAEVHVVGPGQEEGGGEREGGEKLAPELGILYSAIFVTTSFCPRHSA